MKNRFVILTLMAFQLTAAQATYPEKPVKLIITYAAGGQTDRTGRVFAEHLTKELGQPVIVENRPGAQGNIGLGAVGRAEPDGYTIMFGTNGPLAVNPSLVSNMPIDVVKDFTPIGPVAFAYTVLVVNQDSKFNSARELITAAKNSQVPFAYGSAGNGSTPHLSGELFKIRTGVELLHIPYQGDSAAITDLIGNQTQLSFPGLSSALPLISSGRLKALAVSSPQRVKALPDTPTTEEAGVVGSVLAGWMGIFGPANLAPEVILQLSEATKKVVASPAFQKHLEDTAMTPASFQSPEEFSEFHQGQIRLFREIVSSSGMSTE